MGQAFDRDGNVLGDAEGATKAEVLAALEKNHPDAEAILIRTLREKMAAGHGIETDTTTAPAAPTRATDRMEQFFRFAHLPPHLQAVSKPFGELAAQIIATLPSNPERTVALRKLLEAKDCAVRALLFEG
jgi:hypothetical protein